MPESRHRRRGKTRPRPQQVAGPPPPKPKPSPPWVPRVGVGLLILGLIVIIVNYIPGFIEQNWVLLVGFALMAGGFAFLTRWR